MEEEAFESTSAELADGVPAKESLTQPKAGKPKFCQVHGCSVNLEALNRPYMYKKRICPEHMAADVVRCTLRGVKGSWRFCQQCGKLEPLAMFEGTKRSCRVALERRCKSVGGAEHARTKQHKPEQSPPQEAQYTGETYHTDQLGEDAAAAAAAAADAVVNPFWGSTGNLAAGDCCMPWPAGLGDGLSVEVLAVGAALAGTDGHNLLGAASGPAADAAAAIKNWTDTMQQQEQPQAAAAHSWQLHTAALAGRGTVKTRRKLQEPAHSTISAPLPGSDSPQPSLGLDQTVLPGTTLTEAAAANAGAGAASTRLAAEQPLPSCTAPAVLCRSASTPAALVKAVLELQQLQQQLQHQHQLLQQQQQQASVLAGASSCTLGGSEGTAADLTAELERVMMEELAGLNQQASAASAGLAEASLGVSAAGPAAAHQAYTQQQHQQQQQQEPPAFGQQSMSMEDATGMRQQLLQLMRQRLHRRRQHKQQQQQLAAWEVPQGAAADACGAGSSTGGGQQSPLGSLARDSMAVAAMPQAAVTVHSLAGSLATGTLQQQQQQQWWPQQPARDGSNSSFSAHHAVLAASAGDAFTQSQPGMQPAAAVAATGVGGPMLGQPSQGLQASLEVLSTQLDHMQLQLQLLQQQFDQGFLHPPDKGLL